MYNISQKRVLLKNLPLAELEMLRKDNPCKIERNKKIYELYQKGVSSLLLSKVSGLTATSIRNIGKQGHNSQMMTTADQQKDTEALKEVAIAFHDFAIRIGQILKCRR